MGVCEGESCAKKGVAVASACRKLYESSTFESASKSLPPSKRQQTDLAKQEKKRRLG